MSCHCYQLPLVPNYDDEGQFAFLCPLFSCDHSFLLTTVMRQKEPASSTFLNEIMTSEKAFVIPITSCMPVNLEGT